MLREFPLQRRLVHVWYVWYDMQLLASIELNVGAVVGAVVLCRQSVGAVRAVEEDLY